MIIRKFTYRLQQLGGGSILFLQLCNIQNRKAATTQSFSSVYYNNTNNSNWRRYQLMYVVEKHLMLADYKTAEHLNQQNQKYTINFPPSPLKKADLFL